MGFSIDITDLLILGKSILDIEGRIVSEFNDNFPGKEWALCLLKRHNHLTQQMSQNIKNSHASVSSLEIKKFFDNLKFALKYDEASQIPSFF